jgi:hypothetical protein
MERGHQKLNTQSSATIKYVTLQANRERFGLNPGTPGGDLLDNEVIPKFTAFNDAFNAWKDKNSRNIVVTAELHDKEKDFTKVYRKLYSILKATPSVANDDLLNMSFPTRYEGNGTPSKVENEAPSYGLDTSVLCRIRVFFYKTGDKLHSAKPAGQRGAEIKYAILNEKPVNRNVLTLSKSKTRSPFLLEFALSDRGKIVYFTLRWENTRGEKGPWSPIFSVMVP